MNKEARVTVACTDEQRVRWKVYAQSIGMTLGGFVALVAERIADEDVDFKQLRRELNAMAAEVTLGKKMSAAKQKKPRSGPLDYTGLTYEQRCELDQQRIRTSKASEMYQAGEIF